MSDSALTRLAWNCWIPEAVVGDLTATCTAVIESSADDSMVVGLTAGHLYRLWLPDFDQAVHVATAVPELAGRRMTRTRRPQFVAHRRQIPAEDRTTIAGVPVTTLARTWRDLATELSLPDLVAAGDSALRSGAEAAALSAVVRRTSRLRGSRRAREALDLLDRRSRSRGESHLRVAISGPDLPRFEVNEAVHRREGGWLAEPDLSLAEAGIALEYQGAEHAQLERMRKDLTRFTDLRGDGWACFAYGPAETFRRPWIPRAEVRASIRERAPHLLPSRARRSRVVS
jgi:hypothetical protein